MGMWYDIELLLLLLVYEQAYFVLLRAMINVYTGISVELSHISLHILPVQKHGSCSLDEAALSDVVYSLITDSS